MFGKEYQEIAAELEGIKKIIEERNRRLEEVGRKLSQLQRILDSSIIRGNGSMLETEADQDGAIIAKHTVIIGDTLASISDRYYGSPDHWRAIYRANKEIIGSYPNVIRIGQVLDIPKLR